MTPDLEAYKAELRDKIVNFAETNGVLKTLWKTNMNRKTYYLIKHNEIVNVETLKKWWDKICLLTDD